MKRFLILIGILLMLSCENNNLTDLSIEEIIGEYDKDYILKDEDVLLRKAFLLNSQELLNSFFTGWESELSAVTEEQFNSLDYIQKQVYLLYNNFYGLQYGYEEAEYLVLQNEIEYIVIDTAKYEKIWNYGVSYGDTAIERIRIENFLPFIEGTDKKKVYLNQKYTEILNFYINENNSYNYEYDYEKISQEQNLRKTDFLKNKVVLSHHHWVAAYHYYSYPRIFVIVFEKNLLWAKIYYRDSWCTGGTAEYANSKSGWRKTRQLSSWIE